MTIVPRLLCWLAWWTQAILALRVVLRLLRTAGGERIRLTPDGPGAGELAPEMAGPHEPTTAPSQDERVSVIVPVLNERRRLGPCLAGLIMQGSEVVEILVVDGGSGDGTPDLVREAAERDPRIRLIRPKPAPPGSNGKAHDMDAALRQVDARSSWVLTMDADVRPRPGLVRALAAHARRAGAAGVSVAALQEIAGPVVGWVHPALLATLVYRFGMPGQVATRAADALANGQCMMLDRSALAEIGGFAASAHSLAEDVTTARLLAGQGHAVGFFESDGLVSTRMYETGLEAWRNWGRSLPLRDGLVEGRVLVGLLEVLAVQALPGLVLAVALATRGGSSAGRAALVRLNIGLLLMRLGMLVGMRRAYVAPPWTYWLSPLLDLPVAINLMWSASRRDHVWRGRRVRRERLRPSDGGSDAWSAAEWPRALHSKDEGRGESNGTPLRGGIS